LLKGVERLVGRRGKYEFSPDFVLLPMTFGDYVRAVNPNLYNKLIQGNILENLMIYHKNTMHYYWNYLKAGGFPHAQDSLLKHQTIEYYIMREFVNYVRQDVVRGGMSLNLVMSLLRKMIMIFPGITSWRGIASDLGFSHVIISNYAEKLRALFLVEYVYPPKVEAGVLVPNFKKDKKIIFLDPFILYALYHWLYGISIVSRIWDKWIYDTQNRGKLMETLILRHLMYWIYGYYMHEEALDKIFYYRKNDLEVDFIAVRNNEALIIESKRRKKLTRALRIAENIVKPRKAIKILVTEEEIELKKEIIVLPLPYLLFILSTRKDIAPLIMFKFNEGKSRKTS